MGWDQYRCERSGSDCESVSGGELQGVAGAAIWGGELEPVIATDKDGGESFALGFCSRCARTDCFDICNACKQNSQKLTVIGFYHSWRTREKS